MRAVYNGHAVALQLGQGELDTRMEFFPVVLGLLDVGRVRVGHGVVVRVACDADRVVALGALGDLALAAGEGLLRLLEHPQEGLVLDGL